MILKTYMLNFVRWFMEFLIKASKLARFYIQTKIQFKLSENDFLFMMLNQVNIFHYRQFITTLIVEVIYSNLVPIFVGPPLC
jgi:hypothetical protein